MRYKVAVLIDKDNNITSIENAITISVYEKRSDVWCEEKLIHVDLCFSNISTIRQEITTLAEKISDCKIIVGASVSGIVYNIFDRKGFYIFEMDKFSEDTLNSVIQDIEKEQHVDNQAISIEPIEMDIEGYYYFDMVEVMKQNPEVSSKKLLNSFFKTKAFIQLVLICSHIPVWIENNPLFIIKSQITDGNLKVIITRKNCSSYFNKI